MPSEPKAGAVIYALDLGRMSEFYTNVAGLRMTHAGEENAILKSNTFQLTIVKIPPDIAATIEIKSPPVRREDTPIKLVFPVASIQEARNMAAQYGGELDSVEHEWEFQGQKVCDGYDPEGNVLQVRE
jgi:hypothetical protein